MKDFHIKLENNIAYFPVFLDFPEIVHGISTRSFGSIKERGIVFPENLAAFAGALGISPDSIVFTKQVHGANVEVISDLKNTLILDTDGLVTREKNIFVGMATADCLPIIYYDPLAHIIGVDHAGYRGLLAGVITQTIEAFKQLGSKVEHIYVGIGPGIGVCCYNVPENRIQEFEHTFPTIPNLYEKRDGTYFLHLKEITKNILLQAGLHEQHIEDMHVCTHDSLDTFYSYRGDSKETFGEFATIIGMV